MSRYPGHVLFVVVAVVICCNVLALASPSEAEGYLPMESLLAIHTMATNSRAYFNQRLSGIANVTGLDVSVAVTPEQWSCLRKAGYAFAIPRGFRSVGVIDANAIDNVNNAWAAGFENVDYYHFPCPKCNTSLSEQLKVSVTHMNQAKYGIAWLDIEGKQYWTGNHEKNKVLMWELLNAASQLPAKFGIYSNRREWTDIFGDDFEIGVDMPIWYPLFNNNRTFDDFKPFGGFSKPSIKQFSDKGLACEVEFDINVY